MIVRKLLSKSHTLLTDKAYANLIQYWMVVFLLGLRFVRNPRVELAQLKRDMLRLEDQNQRLRGEIADEISIVQAYIDTGKIESYDTIRRRLSRLRGALKYPGIIG